MGGEVNSKYSEHCTLISFLFLCCMQQHGGGVVVDNLGIEAGVLCCCNEPGIAPLILIIDDKDNKQ